MVIFKIATLSCSICFSPDICGIERKFLDFNSPKHSHTYIHRHIPQCAIDKSHFPPNFHNRTAKILRTKNRGQ